jgi:drug/metabolite transporter (DMT)-like permease
MPAGALALLLAAALGHATWNYLAKGARNDAAFTFAFVAVSLVVYAPIAVIAYAIQRPELGWEAFAFMAVSGGVFHVAYYYALATGYRLGDLSLVYPLARGSGPAIAVAGGIMIYGEDPSMLALAGALMVILGIVVMTWSPHVRDGHGDVRLSIAFALLTGAVIGAYTLWDKKGVGLSTPVIYAYGIDVFRILVFAPFVLLRTSGKQALSHAWNEERRAVVGIGVLEPGAYMMVLAALTLAPVSYVAPAREVSILIGALLGWRLLGEGDVTRRLAGAAAIVAGVFALALG